MRFNAPITAVATAGVLGMSFAQSTPLHASTTMPTKSDEAIVALAEKPAEPKQANEQPAAPQPKTVTVQPGDSLASIAEANQVEWTRIFDANEAISNPNSIDAGQVLTIPTADAQLPDRYSQYLASIPAPSVAAATTYTTHSYSAKPLSSSSYYVGNGMWCTDYVHAKRPDVPIYGNAGYNWVSAAQAQGKATGTTPQAGAVAVTNGHVAYVESVNTDGSYVVSEMGWNCKAGNYNKRTVTPGTFGEFIY